MTAYATDVRLRKAGKAVLVATLIVVGVVAMWFGAMWIVFGVRWGKLWGFAQLFGGMRAVIASYDLMWERPPQFSKAPWHRPWEQQNPYG